MFFLVLVLQVALATVTGAIAPRTPTADTTTLSITTEVSTATAFVTSPGDILVINGEPCDNCVPDFTAVNSYPNRYVDESGSTQVTMMYQAAQVVAPPPSNLPSTGPVTSLPRPPSSAEDVITTNTVKVTGSSALGSSKSEISGASSLLGTTSGSNLSTSLGKGTITPSSHKSIPQTEPTTSSSSTSSASSLTATCMTRHLRNILAIYTITFTLFLIPIPEMDILELALICVTSIVGWTLLYFDTLIPFIRHPQAQINVLMKDIKLGLITYTNQRIQSYTQIRRLNTPHTTIRFPPTSRLNPPRGMDAWWKADIRDNLRKHSLQDYFNPADFTFEKYGEKLRSRATPTTQGSPVLKGTPMAGQHNKDDIFSSDEELDTLPLGNIPMTKHQMTKPRRATVPNMQTTFSTSMQPATEAMQVGNISAESKKTAVDATMSPREKVSGFISWDAMKREETATAAPADIAAIAAPAAVTGTANLDAQRAFARLTRAETEGTEESACSWEKEALGAGF